jgi:hypothetical protein
MDDIGAKSPLRSIATNSEIMVRSGRVIMEGKTYFQDLPYPLFLMNLGALDRSAFVKVPPMSRPNRPRRLRDKRA